MCCGNLSSVLAQDLQAELFAVCRMAAEMHTARIVGFRGEVSRMLVVSVIRQNLSLTVLLCQLLINVSFAVLPSSYPGQFSESDLLVCCRS